MREGGRVGELAHTRLSLPATLSSVSLLLSSEYLASSMESNVDILEERTAARNRWRERTILITTEVCQYWIACKLRKKNLGNLH